MIPDNILEEIVKLVADMGCKANGYPALCSSSKQFRQLCQNQQIWEQRCKDKGWDSRPSPMRTWFAHYMINYCIGYLESINDMLLDAAQRGDVPRVKAALASGADPTRSDRFLRYAVASLQPTLHDYKKAGGDMVGVVKLLLQFGPPPNYAMRETLEYVLRVAMLDDEDQAHFDAYDQRHWEFFSKLHDEVGSLLFDYIEQTKYALLQTYAQNMRFYVKIARSVLRSGNSVKALKLLVDKVPSLPTQRFTPRYKLGAWEEAPYAQLLRGRDEPREREIGYRMLEVLLKHDFPTVLSIEEESSFSRYATVVAALEGDCRALGILHSFGAPFPTLSDEHVQELLEEIQDSNDYESGCNMSSYLRQLRLIPDPNAAV